MSSLLPLRLTFALAVAAVAVCLPAATLLAVVSAPVLNNNQPVLNSGSTLTLSWTAPASGTPTSYLVEASSTAGGPANLTVYDTGNTQTSLVVPGVANGIYLLPARAWRGCLRAGSGLERGASGGGRRRAVPLRAAGV